MNNHKRINMTPKIKSSTNKPQGTKKLAKFFVLKMVDSLESNKF